MHVKCLMKVKCNYLCDICGKESDYIVAIYSQFESDFFKDGSIFQNICIKCLELAETAIKNYRKGHIINDNVAWCSVCGNSQVNPSDGIDTCSDCLLFV